MDADLSGKRIHAWRQKMHNSSFQIRANSLFRMVPVVLGTSTSWIAIDSDCIHLSRSPARTIQLSSFLAGYHSFEQSANWKQHLNVAFTVVVTPSKGCHTLKLWGRAEVLKSSSIMKRLAVKCGGGTFNRAERR